MTATFDISVFLDDPSKNYHQLEKETFIEGMLPPLGKKDIETFSAYFELVREEVKALLDSRTTGLSRLEFEYVLAIREVILTNYTEPYQTTKREVVHKLKRLGVEERTVSLAIMFVIRLLLMMKVKQRSASIGDQSNLLQISDCESLKSVVDKIQTQPSLGYWNTMNAIPIWFNAIDLEKKAGLRIDWTHYITEHLTIQGDTLYLFCNIEALMHVKGTHELWVC